jgi:beta-lactamase regulating signal transducer with metallopeptidase domain
MILSMAKELVLAVTLQSTVVLALAWVATLLLSRRSAAARQAIWSSALVALIALPVFSVALPAWDPGLVSSFFGPPPSANEGSTRIVGAAGSIQPPAEAARRGQQGIPAATTLQQETPRSTTLSTLATAAVGLWIAGTAVLLLRLLIHTARAHGIIRRISSWNDPELAPIAESLASKLGTPPYVKIGTDDGVSLPFSWGVICPAVVLPVSARRWPEEQRRSVIAHELAHVARGDHLIHLLVEIVRAIYWPNPLVWFAARRNGVERERACDDLAIGSGTPYEEYASHLVDLARTQLEEAPAGAVMMAGEPGFFERIRCVMNRKVDRSPLRPGFQTLAIVVALFVAAPLAAIGPEDTSWTVPTTSELIAELQDAQDPLARQRAAWWLGEHEDGKAVKPLIETLRDEAAEVRLVAAWALGEIKDRDAIAPLIQNLADEDLLAREMAVLALGEIEDPSAIRALQSSLDREEELREAVIWALGEIRGSEAEAAREEVFSRIGERPWRNDQVWTGTLRKHLEDPSDLSEALRQLRDGDVESRRLAALSIGQIGIRHAFDSMEEIVAAVDGLLVALRDPSPTVRAAAVWSLDEVNPSRSKKHRY